MASKLKLLAVGVLAAVTAGWLLFQPTTRVGKLGR